MSTGASRNMPRNASAPAGERLATLEQWKKDTEGKLAAMEPKLTTIHDWVEGQKKIQEERLEKGTRRFMGFQPQHLLLIGIALGGGGSAAFIQKLIEAVTK